MQAVDTLIAARWIVPAEPQGAVLEHHALALAGDRIVALLPVEQARAQFAPRASIELPTHVLTPGLINAHTHAAMTLLRGVGDDLPLMRWLQERIWPLEQALVSAQFVYDGTRLAAAEMLRAGVTTCSDMYFFPEAAARALREVGMRAVIGLIALEFPSPYANDADDYLRRGLAARDALKGDPLLSFTLAPHAPYTVSDATFTRVVTLAEELDLPIHMHVHETAGEVSDSIAQHGVRPLVRLERLGLVSERLIAVHAVHLNDTEIALLAQRGASIAHCPASNLKLASGIAPIARALAAGVNVAFGTDGAASNNRLDLLEEARFAALLAKGTSNDAAALASPHALHCATLGAARALGLDDRIGSLRAGKQADLAAFDLSAIESAPVFDPISHLLYACSREAVTDVWVAGEHVVRKRQIVRADGQLTSAALLAMIPAWQNKIRRLLSASDPDLGSP